VASAQRPTSNQPPQGLPRGIECKLCRWLAFDLAEVAIL
jgi:hypothetical protein